MAAIKTLNPKAEVARAQQALQMNVGAAIGLQEVLKTNLGPRGTMKMYVSPRSLQLQVLRATLPVHRPCTVIATFALVGFEPSWAL